MTLTWQRWIGGVLAPLLAFGAGAVLHPVQAGPVKVCSPLAVTARVLRSPSPNDTAEGWRGADYVGLGWTFVPLKTLRSDTGLYRKGKLLPPYRPSAGQAYDAYLKAKGQTVWVLASEWDCQS